VIRNPTLPGLPAPPAPGSVGYTSEDDIPTRPDVGVQPELVRLVRLLDCMPPVERRRFLAMVDHYGKLPIGRRVLLEELARELAVKGST
jgi:hypothetical protein